MDQQPDVSWSFEAIGTHWQISLFQPVGAAKLFSLKELIAARIETFDQTYSRFRTDSVVTQMSKAAGMYQLPADAGPLLAWYKELYDVTAGKVTPLIAQSLSDAGYDADYSLQPKAVLRPPASWEETMDVTGTSLTMKRPALLDFGAAGKGYLADIVANVLRQQGIGSFCVNAGGDMVANGITGGLDVGLEHPTDPEQVIGVIHLQDAAICGSAGNRRAWQGYTHILDPDTLRSPKHIAATWCLAADALTADGLATALSFVPPARLQEHFRFDYCIVYADSTIEYSELFKAGVFSAAETVAA